MSSTIQLQNTVNWALPFVRYQPLTIGTTNEPSITNANLIKQTILGPPFIWRWNRATLNTITVAGTQDYSVASTTFGFFEKAVVTDPNGNVTELEWQQILAPENTINRARPTYISTQSDDNAGNITFRFMPVPDQAYTVTIIFQKQPVLFAALTDTWQPIPDYMEYLYQRGFLALSFNAADDMRFQIEHQRFITGLLAAAEGLTEMEKNLFLGNVLYTNSQAAAAQMRTQQATQARGT